MYRLKHLPAVCGLVLLAVIIEIIRQKTNIPVTLLDIFFFPGCLLFSFIFLRYEFLNKKTLFKYNLVEPVSALKKLGVFVGALFLTALGGWCFWMGICEPLTYFWGIKGAAHGYTLVAMGFLISLLGAYGVLKSVLIRFFKT